MLCTVPGVWTEPITLTFYTLPSRLPPVPHPGRTVALRKLCSFLYVPSTGQWLNGKESTCNAGDSGSIPGLGRTPGEGNGNPFQYSCLGNPMDTGVRWVTVQGVAKESDTTCGTWPSIISCTTHTHTHTHTHSHTHNVTDKGQRFLFPTFKSTLSFPTSFPIGGSKNSLQFWHYLP